MQVKGVVKKRAWVGEGSSLLFFFFRHDSKSVFRKILKHLCLFDRLGTDSL